RSRRWRTSLGTDPSKLPDVLARYLSDRLPEAGRITVSDVSRASIGNSRPMWFFDADFEHEVPVSSALVLRMDQTSCFREPEISLEREFEVYRALHGTPVPVVANYWYENDLSWFGQAFVIRQRLDDVETSFDKMSIDIKHRVLTNFVDILAAQHT